MAAGWILRRRLTRLEALLSVALIAVLAWLLIGRARALMAIAEQQAMIATVNNLRTAVNVIALAHLARGERAALAALDGGNPIELAVRRPRNYVGERPDERAAEVPPGSWYFDPRRRLLVYRVSHTERFRSAVPGPPRARFRLVVRYEDRNGNRRFDPELEPFAGIALRAVEGYRWTGG